MSHRISEFQRMRETLRGPWRFVKTRPPSDDQKTSFGEPRNIAPGREAHRGLRGLSVLDRVTGNDPSMADYCIVECMAKCPQCKRELNEKTSPKSASPHRKFDIWRTRDSS